MLLPRLVGDRKALEDAGALGTILSGSGPTILALAADASEAQRIAGRVAGRFADVHLTASPSSGPCDHPGLTGYIERPTRSGVVKWNHVGL